MRVASYVPSTWMRTLSAVSFTCDTNVPVSFWPSSLSVAAMRMLSVPIGVPVLGGGSWSRKRKNAWVRRRHRAEPRADRAVHVVLCSLRGRRCHERARTGGRTGLQQLLPVHVPSWSFAPRVSQLT
jgi:hypothetical protein